MTAAERRASVSLAAIFAARMLGLFLVLPVFALEAARYPGGDDPARVGLALGFARRARCRGRTESLVARRLESLLVAATASPR